MRLRYAALSDVGRVRRDNQDSGYAGPHLLVIADGVGGSARGDIASSRHRRGAAPARRARPATTCLGALAGAIHRSHDRIAGLVAENPEIEGTSTTVTAVDLRRHPHRRRPRRRQPRLPAARRHPLPADHRPHLRAEPDRRGPDHRGRGAGPPAPQPDPARGRRRPRARARRVHPRGRRRATGSCSAPTAARACSPTTSSPALLGEGTPDHAAVSLVSASLDAGSSDNVTVVVADVVADDAVDDADTSAAAVTGPMLVGAAAEAPRRRGHRAAAGRPRRRHRRARAGRGRDRRRRGRRPRGDALRAAPAAPVHLGPPRSPSSAWSLLLAAIIGDRRLQVDARASTTSPTTATTSSSSGASRPTCPASARTTSRRPAT